ncbi:MAG: RIO1 family regulatory kinase/ATPase, partial [Halobacteriaceae archaeon]
NTSNFRHMQDYLAGDPRFEGLSDKKSVVLGWVRKEYSNLQRALEGGVRVPEPIAVQRNVLVMEYIGEEGDPAPRLESVHLENPETAFDVVREYMRRLYSAGLIHGDLSEYNIVVWEGQLYFIDVGQAVTIHHQNADEFLKRDCTNVVRYFNSQGVECDSESLEEYVTDDRRA